MANTIITKNSSTASAVPTSGDLVQGELAVNVTDKRLFTENSGGTVVELGTNPSTMAVAGNATVGGTLGVTGLATLASSTLTANPTLTSGTANGVTYLNGSKVLTSGSAIVFDGTRLGVGVASPNAAAMANFLNSGTSTSVGGNAGLRLSSNGSGYAASLIFSDEVANSAGITMLSGSLAFAAGGSTSEQMRLTSTGLGIGTSSPAYKLDIYSASGTAAIKLKTSTYTAWSLTSQLIGVSNEGFAIRDETAGVNRLSIDTSGNVGIGTSSPSTPLDVQANSLAQGIRVRGRAAGDGGNIAFFSNNNVTEQLSIFSSSSENAFFGTGSRYMSFSTNSVERMRIDSSGNVGIGTSSPSEKLHVVGKIAVSGTNPSIRQVVQNAYLDLCGGTTVGTDPSIQIAGSTTTSDANKVFYNANTHLFRSSSGGTTYSTIDSSGNLLVGTTSLPQSGGVGFGVGRASGNTFVENRVNTATYFGQFAFYNTNGRVGEIATSGSSTSYVTSSDYRLKHDIQPMTGALAKVAALKPVTYKWKADGSDGEGFIAHELAEVCPSAVTGEKDAVDAEGNPVYQGIDTSFLVATLTAAIQEQQSIIESLKARLDAANL